MTLPSRTSEFLGNSAPLRVVAREPDADSVAADQSNYLVTQRCGDVCGDVRTRVESDFEQCVRHDLLDDACCVRFLLRSNASSENLFPECQSDPLSDFFRLSNAVDAT